MFSGKNVLVCFSQFTLALKTLEKDGSVNDVFYGNILRDLVSQKSLQFITIIFLNIFIFCRNKAICKFVDLI